MIEPTREELSEELAACQAALNAAGFEIEKLRAKARIVFREEYDAEHAVGVLVRGDVTADGLDGLEQFVRRQRRRLARQNNRSAEPHPEYGSYWPDDPRNETAKEKR